jgi:hypothetical protein
MKYPKLVSAVACWLFNHDFYIVQEFSHYSRRIACSRCKKSFAMNDDVRACPEWDSSFEVHYKFMGHRIINPWR